MTGALAPTRPLSAADRCDRCGAQAYVRVLLADEHGGGELFFCGHHARAHQSRLREVAADIYDETGRLADTPATAPVDER